MTSACFTKSDADEIANLFFDRSDMPRKPLLGSRLSAVFGIKTKHNLRYLTARDAVILMQQKGFRHQDAEKAFKMLQYLMVEHVSNIVGRVLEKRKTPFRGLAPHYTDKAYLGMKLDKPAIDLRREQEFLTDLKARFSEKLLKDLKPAPRQYQHGPSASSKVHRI